jgi:acyl CoA:acetate/3-ketoacid CoA transferase beta subunit
MADATRDEYCVIACAEAWRGDGAVLASAFGIIPRIGAQLARATFEPALLISDGEASLVGDAGWIPFRSVFDTVWRGARHVMMGATQVDRHGNQNIARLGGDAAKPSVQLLGFRGGPGNTVSHPTSYWIPNHSTRTFVEQVDFVSGVGWDRGAREIRRVVTNLAVLDFETPDHAMRVRSIHPGVTLDEVVENTGFDLVTEDVKETRAPTAEELQLIREVLDPSDGRKTEVAP